MAATRRCRNLFFLSPRLHPELSAAEAFHAKRLEQCSGDFLADSGDGLALCRAHVQVLRKGQQLEIGGGYGVLAVYTGRYGQVMVWTRPAHEAQRLICEGQIIVDKFLEFSGFLSCRAG